METICSLRSFRPGETVVENGKSPHVGGAYVVGVAPAPHPGGWCLGRLPVL
jgi:hypothetical protein